MTLIYARCPNFWVYDEMLKCGYSLKAAEQYFKLAIWGSLGISRVNYSTHNLITLSSYSR